MIQPGRAPPSNRSGTTVVKPPFFCEVEGTWSGFCRALDERGTARAGPSSSQKTQTRKLVRASCLCLLVQAYRKLISNQLSIDYFEAKSICGYDDSSTAGAAGLGNVALDTAQPLRPSQGQRLVQVPGEAARSHATHGWRVQLQTCSKHTPEYVVQYSAGVTLLSALMHDTWLPFTDRAQCS